MALRSQAPTVNPLLPPHPGEGRMRGADAFVDTLVRLGVSDAFNVIGLGMYPLGDAFHRRRSEIRYISHVNETNLALCAQGYARARRSPACAVVYYSSGTSLAMIALTVAWADRVPLVLVSTTNSRRASGRDAYAAVPRAILEMGAQYAKWSYEIPTADRIPESLARAFAIAAQPPMGPVHLAIPADLWGEVIDGAPPRAEFERTTSYRQSLPDAEGIAHAARLLGAAERPVLILGSEVGQYVDAIPSAVRLAETLRAPVLIEEQPSYLAFPTTHPNYVGRLRANADVVTEADVILSVGVEYTSIGLGPDPAPWPSGAQVISMSVDPVLNVRHAWPDVALSGHPGPGLAAIEATCRAAFAVRVSAAERTEALRSRRRARADQVLGAETRRGVLAPWELIDAAHRRFGKDWIVVDALTSAVKHFDVCYDLEDPSRYYGLSGKGSAQGWGAPTAIGVQLAEPERRVACLVGDGNLMFTATSLVLAGRLRLPMVFVVVNNGGWAHVRGPMTGDDYDDERLREMGLLFETDYVGMAAAYGLRAVRAADRDELDRALGAAAQSTEPWLIDAVTRGSDP